jgi:hypothetical protein
VEVTFLDTGKLATTIRVGGGTLEEPTKELLYPDGSKDEVPFQASNTISSFFGQSRQIEIEEQYDRGQMSYRAGIDWRLVSFGEQTNPKPGAVFTPTTDTTANHYFAPRVAAEWHPTYGRITLHITGQAEPWIHYGETYTQGFRVTTYRGATRSAGFGVDLGAGYELVKNRLEIRGGWRFNEIRSSKSNVALGISDNVPQRDRFSGVYLAMTMSR